MIPKEEKLRKRVVAILLAAGKSSRLRRPKQLVPFRGMSLVRRAAMAAIYSQCYKVVVVIGAFHMRVRKEVKHLDVACVRNSLWHRGIGASIKTGIEYFLKKEPKLDAFLFLLCDQPFVSEDHLDRLVEAYEAGTHPIVASEFADTFGVPALIDRAYAEELLEIDDSQGAKSFLEKHIDSVRLVPFAEGHIDVDTPSDLERLRRLDIQKIPRQPELSPSV